MSTTETTTPGAQDVRQRFQAEWLPGLGEQIARLGWDAGRIAEHQRAGLRALLAHAKAHSQFHAERLRDVDPERFELADLASLPSMTKADLVGRFDDVVTDRRLTRAAVEGHVAAAGEAPELLHGEFLCMASGGSSGTRGIFVVDWDALKAMNWAILRAAMARALAGGGAPPPMPLSGAVVAAPTAVHGTRVSPWFIEGPFKVTYAPATLPLGEIVRRLNEAQPYLLIGYPSVLRLLAAEQAAGRLAITPAMVSSTSEQLTREAAQEIAAAFGVGVSNTFGASEGLFGTSDPGDEAIVFASDQVIVEPVDAEGRPVPAGTPSASVLITNLCNLAQPLIRYRLEDSFVQHPPAEAHGHFRASVAGRSDEAFTYGDVQIHPLVLRSPLVKTAEVLEYQVRQTPRGVDVDVVVSAPVDERALAARLAEALGSAGLRDAEVAVRTVERVERHAQSGKARRFVPLARGA
jgi:phenylacetate-CoA ligase